jgi:hypothetical protein
MIHAYFHCLFVKAFGSDFKNEARKSARCANCDALTLQIIRTKINLLN